MKAGTSQVTQSDKHANYCAICTCCIQEDPTECPECSSPRPQNGWPIIEQSPYPYLGKILDGRYLLNQFLGDGATGYVYRAQAMQIARFFAAKIVDTRRYGKPEFEQELLRRFKLEVEAMSQLRNPHVVNVYEAMQLQDDVFVLLMDFVDGRTLQELLDRVGRIKLNRALEIMRQIANGLYEAHALGFIHRDLKPDNIMIERLPASGFFARILDFGIVHVMGGVGASSTQGFRGTPLYASPEQCLGDPKIDHRSDIYSLGCVFFHCVTGQPPFPGTESLEVMDAHVNNSPPHVHDIVPSSRFPASLDKLLQSMLAKDPDERPANLNLVIQAIDRLQMEQHSLDEGTNADPPPQFMQQSDVQQFDLRRRIETADFPVPTLGEASSSGSTQIVRPLLEFNLPDDVAAKAGAFTASTLNNRGEFCAVADKNNLVHVIGMRNDGYFETLRGAKGLITTLFIDGASREVFAAELDGTLLRWHMDEPQKTAVRMVQLPHRVYAIASDRRGKILCGTERGEVISVDLKTQKFLHLVPYGPPVSSLAMSTSENKLFCGYWGGDMDLLGLGDKKKQKIESMPSNPISMVVSDDGYVAAVLDEQHNVRILSLVHGSSFFEITADMAHLKALAFDKSSQLLGMGINNMVIQLWDIRNQPAMKHLE